MKAAGSTFHASAAPSVPAIGSLTEYIFAALAGAKFKSLDDEGVWGEIPEILGVWANAPSEVECAAELQSVLEDWLLLSLVKGHPIPAIGDLEIRPDLIG